MGSTTFEILTGLALLVFYFIQDQRAIFILCFAGSLFVAASYLAYVNEIMFSLFMFVWAVVASVKFAIAWQDVMRRYDNRRARRK